MISDSMMDELTNHFSIAFNIGLSSSIRVSGVISITENINNRITNNHDLTLEFLSLADMFIHSISFYDGA